MRAGVSNSLNDSMTTLTGKNVVLTGASGGLGVYIAEALASSGANLFLVAYPGDGLARLSQNLRKHKVRTSYAALNLLLPADRKAVVEQAAEALGSIDVLVNNAGVEINAPFHELSESDISDVLTVNLEAPMMLTRALLPQMVERKQGHIVNVSSLAGKSGPAFQESYAASKAGLTAFTYSLRGTYAGTGVSASVISPGFVEAGIYTRLKEKTGCPAPFLLGACSPERVAKAVIRAVQRDVPEIVVSRYPVWPILALSVMSPSLGTWLTARLGVHEFFRKAVQSQARGAEERAEAKAAELSVK
jgi:short-subunit dehydrogenase